MERTETKIRTLYEMLFPYGTYNGDAALGCIAINRELRNLCKGNMRHVLLLVGRYLGHRFTPDTPTNDICKTIQDDIYSVCLGTGLTDEERVKVIVGLKSGVTRPLTELQIMCKKHRGRFYNPFVALFSIRSNRYWDMLYEYLRTKDDTEEEENGQNELEDWAGRIYVFEGWENVLNMLKQGKYMEVFKMGLEEKGMISLGDSTQRYPLDVEDVRFFNYIIEGFLSGRFDFETTTWNDVCK